MRITEPVSGRYELIRQLFHLGPDFEIPSGSKVVLVMEDDREVLHQMAESESAFEEQAH